jgi:membrane protein DedA with SNARE-associated domain
MRLLGAFLWVVARIVPGASRGRWIEEWRAELAHGRRSMVAGSLPDAWALRRLRGNRPARREPLFHAFLQDIRYLGPVRE